jgi:hypothetical protein
MKTFVVAIAVLACAQPVAAHQLDEYLQATRIAIEPDRVVLEVNLTPGVAVAEQIFAALDRDRDTRLSAGEIADYGRQVLQDLSLDLDGRSLPLALARAESPARPELGDGMGTVRLSLTAGTRVARGRHRLRFMNRHRADISVYLVNALVPSTATISIRGQERDTRQHGISIEFDRGMAYPSSRWVLFPLVGLAALGLSRRRRLLM